MKVYYAPRQDSKVTACGKHINRACSTFYVLDYSSNRSKVTCKSCLKTQESAPF